MIMENSMGEKRSANIFDSQTELLKKKKERFLREARTTMRYWRRLVSSSARSNESLLLECSKAWEPTNGESACRDRVG